MADVHKCFVLGFWQDEKKVDGRRDAEHDEHQEGKGLQRLLHRGNQKKKKKNTGRNETDESDQMLPSLQLLIKPTAHNVINLVIYISAFEAFDDSPPPPLHRAKSCHFPASIMSSQLQSDVVSGICYVVHVCRRNSLMILSLK